MNRTIYMLPVLFLLAFSNELKAQDPIPAPPDTKTEEIRRKVRIGLQVSPEISWMKAQDNNISSGGTKFGFSFGPMVDFRFGENYALGTGLSIVNSQGELTYLGDSVMFNSQPDVVFRKNTKVSYKLRYVELPIVLRLNTNEIGYIRYFAHFGFVPAVKIGARGQFTDAGTDPHGNAYNNNTAANVDIGKDVSFPNMSLMVGAGITYALTPTTSLYVSVSFVNGFIDVTDNPKNKDGITDEQKDYYKSKAVLNRIPLTVGIFF